MEILTPVRKEPPLKYHPSLFLVLTRYKTGTVPGGQFNWGGCLPNGNGGAQRSPQGGWKSPTERIGIRGLDCEANKPSRDESRAK